MTHEEAFRLVEKHALVQAGLRWNTTHRTGCDTAWAVADQYGEDEIAAAIFDLQTLANGTVPRDWEPAK